MKRKLAVSAALAFLLCNVLGQAQVAPATIVAVKTPGGTVNAVAKFTAKNIIANSAISESGGNVTVPGNITAGQGVSGLNVNATDTVSGGNGIFQSSLLAETINATGNLFAGGGVTAATANITGNILAGSIGTAGAGSFGSIVETGNISGAQGSFNGFAATGLFVTNNNNNATLELTNDAAASGSNFTEAQFNSTRATFFTDTKGDTTAIGTKSAAVPLADGSMAKVFSVEAPEVLFEDYGSGQLSGGIASVSVEGKFAQTVNLSKGYYVFFTPKGDCKGLYVTNETDTGFEVRDMSGGASSVPFDYHIVAYRNGYENVRLPAALMPKTRAAVPSK